MEEKKLLIVDDDFEIRTLLAEYLEKNGFEVITLPDGGNVESVLKKTRIDLVILDVMMPGDDGYEVCRKIRSWNDVPIIMLTARSEEVDRIVGLEIGADDYLAKPFSSRELLARVKAILRRTERMDGRAVNRLKNYLFLGWTLETGKRQLIDNNGVVISLSGVDYNLLKVFLDHPNRVLTRDQLLDYTQGREAMPFDRAIDVQVSRLRQRLKDDPKSPNIIKTVRGEGYIFIPDVIKK